MVNALAGRFVPAGPSGAPTRGMAHVLPTGRNFYSVDPKALPSAVACEVGAELAAALLRRHLEEEGRYPDTVGLVVWGTAAMRTQGDDIGEILAPAGGAASLGHREPPGHRHRGDPARRAGPAPHRRGGAHLGILPGRLSQPRSPARPGHRQCGSLDEDDRNNHVAKHFREERDRKLAAGMTAEAARRTSLYRIFGSPARAPTARVSCR